MRRAALLAAALAFVAVSCGSPSMSGEAADALQGHMQELRSAVEREKPQQAEARLNKLRAAARQRADEGQITADRLAQIESAAAQVEKFLDELGTRPSPDPEPTPEPTPEEDDDTEDKDEKDRDEKEKDKKEKEKEKKDKKEKEKGEEGDGGPGENETDTARATWAGWQLGTTPL